MKIVLDLAASKAEAPVSLYSKYKGVKHVNRIITNLNNIDPDVDSQIREQVNDLQNVRDLEASFSTYNYIYNQLPIQVVCNEAPNSLEFTLVNGFCRYDAFRNLGWDVTIVDVLEFDTPLAQLEFSLQANHIRTPSGMNTAGDVAHACLRAIRDGILPNDVTKDGPVYKFLENVIEGHRPEVLRTAFAKVSAQVNYENDRHLALDDAKAKSIARSLGMPCDANLDYGYVKNSGGSKNIFWDAMRLHLKEDVEVTLGGYIQNPMAGKLNQQRIQWLKEFDDMRNTWMDMCEKATGVRPKASTFPIRFVGFLPQNHAKDPTKGGRPVEESIISEEQVRQEQMNKIHRSMQSASLVSVK